MIKLKEGQQVEDVNGNVHLIEKGDYLNDKKELKEAIVPTRWKDNEELADLVYDALLDANLDPRYRDVRNGDYLQIKYDREWYGLELVRIV